MKYSPYRFRCFFNKWVWCAQFNPKMWKKKRVLPEPCKRCKYYLNRPQKRIEPFMSNSSNTGLNVIGMITFEQFTKKEDSKKVSTPKNRGDNAG